jgi:hypothetical protein
MVSLALVILRHRPVRGIGTTSLHVDRSIPEPVPGQAQVEKIEDSTHAELEAGPH